VLFKNLGMRKERSMSGWLAGVAEFDITPPLGVSMTGYAGRPGPADHLLDPLHVRALALAREGEPPIVLTGADLLGIDAGMVAAIQHSAAGTVAPERLLLNHSHTHAGPTLAPLRCMGSRQPAYAELVVRWTVSAIREAVRNLRPAQLSFGTSTTAIGINRRELRQGKIVLGRNEAGTYDPTVSVLRVEGADGSPLACWFSHATHPVVMGGQNTGLSAEWPGIAASMLAYVLGCPAVFAQGCSGDINPARQGNWGVVRSVGRELAGAALAAWERATPVEDGPVLGALVTASLPQRHPELAEAEAALETARERLSAVEHEIAATPDITAATAMARLQTPRGQVEWAEDYLVSARAESVPPVSMPVQALRLGDVCLTATGAETFVEIGMAMNRRAGTPRAVSLGFSNGCFGYLPTESAFALGGYEVNDAYRYYGTLMVTPDCERLTLDAADEALQGVGLGADA
jgi:hypothetical protein